MAIERCLICDDCGRIIDGAPTVKQVRAQAKKDGMYRRVNGRDICAWCLEGTDPRD